MKMNDYKRTWDSENKRWIYEHRCIMEKHLGRVLSKDEHVHHLDGDPKNNAIENLELTTINEHIRLHKPALKNRQCSIDGCTKKHHGKGYCKAHYAKMFRKSQGW